MTLPCQDEEISDVYLLKQPLDKQACKIRKEWCTKNMPELIFDSTNQVVKYVLPDASHFFCIVKTNTNNYVVIHQTGENFKCQLSSEKEKNESRNTLLNHIQSDVFEKKILVKELVAAAQPQPAFSTYNIFKSNCIHAVERITKYLNEFIFEDSKKIKIPGLEQSKKIVAFLKEKLALIINFIKKQQQKDNWNIRDIFKLKEETLTCARSIYSQVPQFAIQILTDILVDYKSLSWWNYIPYILIFLVTVLLDTFCRTFAIVPLIFSSVAALADIYFICSNPNLSWKMKFAKIALSLAQVGLGFLPLPSTELLLAASFGINYVTKMFMSWTDGFNCFTKEQVGIFLAGAGLGACAAKPISVIAAINIPVGLGLLAGLTVTVVCVSLYNWWKSK